MHVPINQLFVFYTGCSYPLGMENRDLPDAQITASSEYDATHGPSNGRLNFKAGRGKTGAWSAKTNDVHQWLQVDLGQEMEVQAIQSQGRQDRYQWVKSYTVSYSNDGITFTAYGQNRVCREHCKKCRKTCKRNRYLYGLSKFKKLQTVPIFNFSDLKQSTCNHGSHITVIPSQPRPPPPPPPKILINI